MFAYAAETLVFGYLGLAVFTFDHSFKLSMILLSTDLILVGTAFNIFPLSKLVNRWRSPTSQISLQSTGTVVFGT